MVLCFCWPERTALNLTTANLLRILLLLLLPKDNDGYICLLSSFIVIVPEIKQKTTTKRTKRTSVYTGRRTYVVRGELKGMTIWKDIPVWSRFDAISRPLYCKKLLLPTRTHSILQFSCKDECGWWNPKARRHVVCVVVFECNRQTTTYLILLKRFGKSRQFISW